MSHVRAGNNETAVMSRSELFGNSIAVIYNYISMTQYCNVALH